MVGSHCEYELGTEIRVIMKWTIDLDTLVMFRPKLDLAHHPLRSKNSSILWREVRDGEIFS